MKIHPMVYGDNFTSNPRHMDVCNGCKENVTAKIRGRSVDKGLYVYLCDPCYYKAEIVYPEDLNERK